MTAAPLLVFIGLFAASVAADCGGAPAPGVRDCVEMYATQYVDQFSWNSSTYRQRYFVYDKSFRPRGPILFYTGNEANVEVYVNCTGLMWENAAALGAVLVFAEHRYFGKSQPCQGGFRECGAYLSTEQAMADYASLIRHLRGTVYPQSSAVVVFGGSYGGMLSAWMRLRYPSLVDGAIASSAPIATLDPTYNGASYWRVVTADATAAGGSIDGCAANVYQAFRDVFTLMATAAGRATVQRTFRLCNPVGPGDATAVALFLQAAFDLMAMGDYPFSTYYICGNPTHPCPAWPMRVACAAMTNASTPAGRMANLYRAISVVNNVTLNVPCYNISGLNPNVYSPIWDFMVCTEGMINEQPYFAATGWPNDMFWRQKPYTPAMLAAHCEAAFGYAPRKGLLNANFGVSAMRAASNIVFANGLLDPWHSGGILTDLSPTLTAVIIKDGAHHLDLFFSTPNDPPSVTAARATQLAHIKKWITEAQERR